MYRTGLSAQYKKHKMLKIKYFAWLHQLLAYIYERHITECHSRCITTVLLYYQRAEEHSSQISHWF